MPYTLQEKKLQRREIVSFARYCSYVRDWTTSFSAFSAVMRMGVVYPDSEKTRGTEVLRTLSRPLQKLTQIGIADGDAADFALDAGEGVVYAFCFAVQLRRNLTVRLA